MFLIILTYKKGIGKVNEYLLEYFRFLNVHYSKKKFIFSGKQTQQNGGVILAYNCNKEYIESTIKEDPFFQNEIADYEIIEFEPSKYDRSFIPYVY